MTSVDHEPGISDTLGIKSSDTTRQINGDVNTSQNTYQNVSVARGTDSNSAAANSAITNTIDMNNGKGHENV